MAVNVAGTKVAYQKTKVFDTAGAHTFVHPLPGKNIEVFVELIGAAGGGTNSGTSGGDGGASIWDTGGSNTTANGGSGSADNTTAGSGFINGYNYTGGNQAAAVSVPTIMSGLYGNAGGVSDPTDNTATGGSGYVKRFNATISGDINITVGAAGSNTANINPSQDGACIVHYNVIESETPVMVSATPQVDEYLEFTWRSDVNAPSQDLGSQAVNTLWLDTEVLDTGNYGSVTSGSNTFSLDAGTYEFEVFVPLYDGTDSNAQSNTIMLWNETDGQLERSILSPTTFDSYSNTGHIPFKGVIKIASTKSFSLKFQSSDTAANADYYVGPEYAFDPTTGTHDRTRITLTRKAYS